MNEEEEEKCNPRMDICAQINLISSIQYQQNELSKLATLLQSEKDREKYIKVIEMSKIIQAKLDDLQEEKNRTFTGNRRVNSFGQSINKKNSMWSLNQYTSHSNSRCSSRTSYTTDDHTISTANSNYCGNNTLSSYNKNDESNMIFTDHPSSRYHTYTGGHTYRIIDKMTSMHFKQQGQTDVPTASSRRPSVDTHVRVSSDKEKNVIYVKPNSMRKTVHSSKIASRPPSPSSIPAIPPIPKHIARQLQQQQDESDEEEEVFTSTAIHVAVRRDASLFKIEKLSNSNPKESLNTNSVTIATPLTSSPASSSPPLIPPTTIPIVKKKSSFMSSKQSLNNQSTEKKRVSFSDDKKKKRDMGLLTPPDSPQSQNKFDSQIVQSESFLDLSNTPSIIHVQKKTHQSLKGLLKRSYHLNQYTVTKTNSLTLPHSTDGKLLYKTFNSITGKAKFLLKIMIVSLDMHCSKEQNRFGFTFWWQSHYSYHAKNEVEDAKFALAPDSLVKEALITWIQSQNEVLIRGGGVTLLPTLFQSDEILRDGRKLYVVYDTSLFKL